LYSCDKKIEITEGIQSNGSVVKWSVKCVSNVETESNGNQWLQFCKNIEQSVRKCKTKKLNSVSKKPYQCTRYNDMAFVFSPLPFLHYNF